MPILPLEATIFPEDLLESDETPCWTVVHTRPRQEKSLARDLVQRAIPFYLPLVQKTNIIGSRRLTSHLPLFPGYVFLGASREEVFARVRVDRIAKVMAVTDGQQLRQDLQRVRYLVESGAPLTVEARLTAGQRVVIRRGPMQGLEGTVIRRQRKTRLLVAVNMLQQGVSVEIDDFLLEPID